MNMVDPAAGLFSAWLLGISLGLTACTVTCLPFMGTWVMGRERGAVLADTSAFLAGRVLAYAVLGGVAGLAGAWLTTFLQRGVGHFAIGAAAVAAGWWLMAGPSGTSPKGTCGASRRGAAPPFALGFSLSLTPCAPLASLLAFAAQAGSVPWGAAQGFAFGLGAAVTPLLLALPLLGAFASRLRDGRAWLGLRLRQGAGGVLIVLGAYRIAMGT